MPPLSPTVASWELVLRLRERRQQLGIEVKEITQTLGFSRNYWSAVENDRKILSEDSLTRLADLFEFDDDEQRELHDLRTGAKQRGWWTRYSGLIDADLQRLYGLECGAEIIRTYENVLIPGLLQTPEYARALMNAGVMVRQVEIDQLVEIRMRRQERLEGDDPLRLTAVIGEASLRQQIGGPAVLRNQLDRLALHIESHPETIDVRVVPFTATTSELFGASTLHLISFAKVGLPTIAWHETVSAKGVIEDPTLVRDLSMSLVDTLERALTRDASLTLIRRCAEELA
ncbi:transcriptional regulator [Actinophytocola xinjiangensis]|uniref:Transcriptional regulator n=1 Tax=Actinophytocola xinjiangensis TaxID=485602 RepID=A0A7Z1AZQ0_9PSEU|nr:Scr1 family TA system antitoxin-like transcriptional regulator [Actinophytocola xinjiangensis]OLF12190.1 transcriptional regulator [Actinophytocola xinjiangensis]